MGQVLDGREERNSSAFLENLAPFARGALEDSSVADLITEHNMVYSSRDEKLPGGGIASIRSRHATLEGSFRSPATEHRTYSAIAAKQPKQKIHLP